ncbi:MAG TPA: hypothetical protein ENI91_04435, partial [Sphingomonadales bacterium]|nr:hypothetical protein [Sphingomonadales bacterium]
MNSTDLSNMDMDKFGCLDQAKRIWAVAAIHGQSSALADLHEELVTKFQAGDRLVYLGNYFGRENTAVETVN